MPCPCKPTRVTFVEGRRIDRADVCLKHDEVRPGALGPCPRCGANGRVHLGAHTGGGVPLWSSCPTCEGRRVVYLLDEAASA